MSESRQKYPAPLPRGTLGDAQGPMALLLLAGIRAGRPLVRTFPEQVTLQWRLRTSEGRGSRLLTVAGAAQAGGASVGRVDLCFPFNCADVKTGTSTNGADCKQHEAHAYNPPSLISQRAMSKTQELADRVERLLLRHEELKRTNGLLEQQVATLTNERDNLRSRLNAARSRIDALLDRIPVDAPATARNDEDAP
jgi:uncharacterized protein (TIGR02449 family)